MAPKRSSSSTASFPSKKATLGNKKAKSSAQTQATLSWSTSKAPSTSTGKKGKQQQSTLAKRASLTSVASPEPAFIASDSEAEEADEEAVELPSPARAKRAGGVVAKEDKVKVVTPGEEDSAPAAVELYRDGREWNRAYEDAKVAMGSIKPIHAAHQSKIDHILRVFDMSAQYGPCTSLSRLARWERAERLGLNPPADVKKILLTKQGEKDPVVRENVFFGAI